MIIFFIRTTKTALSLGVVFIFFGFLDNSIMILAGDQIDTYIKAFGFSTLLAAGLGNTFSDMVGISVGRYVETFFRRHFAAPENIPTTQVILFETVGICLGCLLGLTPLYFLH